MCRRRWAAVFLAGLLPGALAGEDLSWQRRALRAASPEGYLAVISLARTGQGAIAAALDCESEKVALRIEGTQWAVTSQGTEVARGTVDASAPPGFFVKRTPQCVLLGVNGRWVYRQEAAKAEGVPAVRVGVGPGLKVESLRVVAREPVRFADDFPDPEPKSGLWVPVRGRWALSSLSFPEQSANPAELMALFDEFEDEASRGRTREANVGVGIQLAGGRFPQILRLAGNSPAGRAGLRQGDVVRQINDRDVYSAAQAMALLDGNIGEPVTVTVQRDGELKRVELKRELVIWGRTRRQEPIEPWREDRAALIVAGSDFWADYRFSIAAQTRGIGAFGLVFAYLGPKDYHVFRWLGAAKGGNGTGRWQLERVRGGQAQVVAQREGGFLPNDFYAMSVALSGEALGAIKATCKVDTMTVFEASDDAIVPGKIGLWAEAPGVMSFDDVAVATSAEPRRRADQGSKNLIQRTDRVMRAWADPAEGWLRSWADGLSWNKSNFPGPVALTAPMALYEPLRLVVGAGTRDPDSGYGFELAGEPKRGTLKRQGKAVAAKPLTGDATKEFTLVRDGPRIRVLRDEAPWLDFEDPEPLAGTELAIGGVAPSAVRVQSPNVVEDYFNSSPTEWHVMSGSWEVMNRWICDPRWSFFGGRSDDLLAIWSKRRLEGDCFFDVHVCFMMLNYDRAGTQFETVRDLGITLCGDGANLASGYAVIVGAAQNSITVLFREGVPVASTSDRMALLPNQGIARVGDDIRSQHRGWIHVKFVREKRRIRVYVYDRLVIDFQDPNPLPGGHVAIWTTGNGLLVGKTRVAATRLGPPVPFLQGAGRFADRFLTNDCYGGETRITPLPPEGIGTFGGDSSPAYEITNTIGGGPFAVALRPRVFSAVERPTLSFDVKLNPDVKVDLYFSCQGTRYRVVLSGPDEDTWAAQTLGRFAGARPDGRWHRVTFDLLGALRRLYPDDPLLMVWEPTFENRSNWQYLMAGFGGNRAGATWWLRGLSLAHAAAPPPRLSRASTY